jgi:hypothetical protein
MKITLCKCQIQNRWLLVFCIQKESIKIYQRSGPMYIKVFDLDESIPQVVKLGDCVLASINKTQ